jgi:hypothetical protein
MPTKTPVHGAQVEPVGVIRVRWHGDIHPVVRHTQVLELDHLLDGRSGVAGGAEFLPCKVRKTLLVQPVCTKM